MGCDSRVIRAKILLIMGVIISTGCAARVGTDNQEEEGYFHHYSLSSAESIRFANTANIIMTVDMAGMGMMDPINLSIPMTVSVELEEQSDGGYKGSLIIEEYNIEGMEGIFGMIGGGDIPDMIAMTGKRIPVTMDRSGKSETSMETLVGIGGIVTNMLGELGRYFIPWPSTSLVPGSSWSDSVFVKSEEAESSENLTSISDYQYLGLTTVEEGGESSAVHAVHADVRSSMEQWKPIDAMGFTEMTMSATGKMEADLFFNPIDGILENAHSSTQISIVMNMFGPMEISMSIEMTGTIVTKRIH